MVSRVAPKLLTKLQKWKWTGHHTGVSATLFSWRRINFTLRASFGLGVQSFSFACHFKQKWKVFVHNRQFDIRFPKIPFLYCLRLFLAWFRYMILRSPKLLECFKFINSYFCNTQNWLWQRRLGTWSYYCFNKKECHRYWKTIIWLKMA